MKSNIALLILSLSVLIFTDCRESSSRARTGRGRSTVETMPKEGEPKTTIKEIPQDETKEHNKEEEIAKNRNPMSGPEIFEKYNNAVFMIWTSNGIDKNKQGSGFFINSSGLAVSNYHVFEGTTIGYEVIKLQDGRQYKLKDVILKDKANDIIIFTIDAESTSFKYLPLSTRKPRVGDKAYAIGSPRGLENTFSSGEISQLREDNIIQISVPIDHGSSGGALINEYGEAIGITTSGIDVSGANLNFAVSTDLVRNYLR